MPENKCKRSKGNQLCLQVRQMKNNGKCSHFEKLGTYIELEMNPIKDCWFKIMTMQCMIENIRRQMFALKF